MKCQYCGEEYARAKYSESCKSCYGPAPKKPKPYEVSHDIKELKITQSPAVIMVGSGGGGGYYNCGGPGGGSGGGAGYRIAGGSR